MENIINTKQIGGVGSTEGVIFVTLCIPKYAIESVSEVVEKKATHPAISTFCIMSNPTTLPKPNRCSDWLVTSRDFIGTVSSNNEAPITSTEKIYNRGSQPQHRNVYKGG